MDIEGRYANPSCLPFWASEYQMSQRTHSQGLDWIPYASGLVMLVFVVGGVSGLLYTTGFAVGQRYPRVEWTIVADARGLGDLFRRTELIAGEQGFAKYRGLGWKADNDPVTTGNHHEWQREGRDMLVLQLPRQFQGAAERIDVRISWVRNKRGALTETEWQLVSAINQSMRTQFYDMAQMTVHPAEHTSAEDLCHHAIASDIPLPLGEVERANVDAHPGCAVFVMASR